MVIRLGRSTHPRVNSPRAHAARESSAVQRPGFEAGNVWGDALRLAQALPSKRAEQLEAEESTPVGTDAFDGNEWFYPIWDGIEAGATTPTPWAFSDRATVTFIEQMFDNTIEGKTLGRPSQTVTPDGVNLLRHFVRAKELGEDITIRSPHDALWRRQWPVDDATASLLVRAAKAFGVDPSEIAFNGATLAEHLPSMELSGLHPSKMLESRFASIRLATALARTPSLRLGVREFIDGLGMPDELHAVLKHQLKLPAPQEVAHEESSSYGKVPDRRLEAGWGGYPVERHPISQGDEVTNYKSLKQDAKWFGELASDANLKTFINREGAEVETVLRRGEFGGARPADVYLWAARAVELQNQAKRRSFEDFETDQVLLRSLLRTAGGLPDYSPESVPPLIRLAKALSVPLHMVIMTRRPDGTEVTLEQRARQLGLDPLKVSDGDPTPFLNAFRNKGNDQGKLAALERLQSTAPDAPSFWDVIRGAAGLVADGALEPIRWSGLSVDEQLRLSQLLTADDNHGAAVALTGLFVEGLPTEERGSKHPFYDTLKDVTLGHKQFFMTEWQPDTAAEFAALSPDEKLFVLEDVLADPPSFGSMPFRLEKVRATDEQAVELGWWGTYDNDAGKMRALVDLAISRGEGAKALLSEAINDSHITAADLSLAMAGGRGAELIPPSTMKALETQAKQAIKTGSTKALNELAEAIEALPRFIDRAAVVSNLLSGLHEGAELPAPLFETKEQSSPKTPSSAALDVIESTAGLDLSAFDEIPGLQPMEFSKNELRAKAIELMLALAKLKMNFSAASSATLRKEALELVQQHLRPRLTAAASAEEKFEVYSVGRAALNDFNRHVETLDGPG